MDFKKKEVRLQYARDYYRRNKEKAKENRRKWGERNREKIKVYFNFFLVRVSL